jgi:death-on-curing protein
LTVEIVREIHAEPIKRFGGSDGVREEALVESAVAAPQASFGGQSPYRDLLEVAAAYLFYLCRNHPFVDGNKRAALGACLVFLRLNGIEPAPDSPEWESLTLDVAASRIDRDQTTKRLRKLVRQKRGERRAKSAEDQGFDGDSRKT